MYKGDPKMNDAVEKIVALASENGIGAMELALRWVVHDSPLKEGDGVLFGASREEQVRENIGWIEKGGLEKSIVEKLDGIWEGVRDVAPGGDLSR